MSKPIQTTTSQPVQTKSQDDKVYEMIVNAQLNERKASKALAKAATQMDPTTQDGYELGNELIGEAADRGRNASLLGTIALEFHKSRDKTISSVFNG